MPHLDIEWAVDVGHVLRRRHIQDSGSESSRAVTSLLDILTAQPPPASWQEVLKNWDPIRYSSTVNKETRLRQVSRLRELLIRASSGLNTENLKGGAQFRMRTRVTNQLTTAQLLLDAGYHSSARATYQCARDVSRKFQLTDCSIRATCALRTLTATTGNRSELRKYDKAIAHLRSVQDCELEAQSLLDHARAVLTTFTSNRTSAVKQFNGIINRLNTLSSRSDATATLIIAQHRASLWFASITRDPGRILKVATPAIKFLNEHPFVEHPAYRTEFEGSRLTAMLALKDYDGATSAWNAVQSKVTEGAANWVALLQTYFLACTSTKHYDAARDALYLYETRKKTGGPEWRASLWRLYRAYILLLIDQQLVEPKQYTGAPKMYPANLERQLNQHSHDKLVYGPAASILRILQSIRSKKYSELVDQVESLRQYAYRHLTNKQTARTAAFLRMLATIPAADFDPQECNERGMAVWRKHPDAHSLQRDSAEIVPYEDLWQIAIRMLQDNVGVRRR